MKRLVCALTATALLVSPLCAAAQVHGGHGGFSGHAGFSGHGGFSGAGHYGSGGFHTFSGGGFSGGYRGHGLRGGFLPFFGGFGLGLAFADPWFYDGWWGPDYWGPGYWGWGYPYAAWGYDGDDYGPPPPPAPGAAPPPPACGSWNWRPDLNRYVWIPAPCAAPEAPTTAQ